LFCIWIYKFKRFIRIICSFYVICFAFGGGAFALYYFTDISSRLNIILNNGVFYMQLSLPMLLIFIAASFILINYVFWLFKDRSSKKDLYVELEIFLNNKSCSTKAFLDTGNMLKNPLTNKGVVVCQLNW
jgi:stage II sporulation protein GA (sporulation sigma-E factor processing peptidase)